MERNHGASNLDTFMSKVPTRWFLLLALGIPLATACSSAPRNPTYTAIFPPSEPTVPSAESCDAMPMIANRNSAGELTRLYLTNSKGDAPVALTPDEPKGARTQFLQWSQDGKKILYLSSKRDPKYMDLYERDKIPLPKNFLPQHPFDNGDMTVRDEALLPWPRTEAAVRKELQIGRAHV